MIVVIRAYIRVYGGTSGAYACTEDARDVPMSC